MNGLPTGRYTVIRGTVTTNDYGDEIEAPTEHLTGLLGSVVERTRTNFNPESSRIVTLRQYTGRFKFGTDIKDGDRIVDEKSGMTFLVNSVGHATAVVNKPDLVLDLSVN